MTNNNLSQVVKIIIEDFNKHEAKYYAPEALHSARKSYVDYYMNGKGNLGNMLVKRMLEDYIAAFTMNGKYEGNPYYLNLYKRFFG